MRISYPWFLPLRVAENSVTKRTCSGILKNAIRPLPGAPLLKRSLLQGWDCTNPKAQIFPQSTLTRSPISEAVNNEETLVSFTSRCAFLRKALRPIFVRRPSWARQRSQPMSSDRRSCRTAPPCARDYCRTLASANRPYQSRLRVPLIPSVPLIDEMLIAHQLLSAYELEQSRREQATRLLVPDALTNPEHL